jgi:hypothetical protein
MNMFGHAKKFRTNNKFLFERYLILNTIFFSQTNNTKKRSDILRYKGIIVLCFRLRTITFDDGQNGTVK